jgi:hypothetical protein
MSPIKMNGVSGGTTPDQDQILITFLQAKVQYEGIPNGSRDISPEEERILAQFEHARELLLRSDLPRPLIDIVCKSCAANR